MKFAMVAAILAAAVWALPVDAQTSGKKIQCWTDKSGQRMCGDRVPQEYAGEKRDVIKGGRVVETVKAMKTPEEIAAEKRRKQEEEDKRKAADYDRALLESYRGLSDITAMRDERLELIDLRIQAAEKNAADADKSLTGLRTRAEQAQEKGEPVDEKLAKQIRQFEKSQRQSAKALERYHTEREALLTKFGKDYVRYSELRGLPATAPPPPKAAAAATPAVPAAKPASAKAAPAAGTAPSANAPPKTGG
jgi:hypothetical protein